jgi:NADH dehydrogenase/endonuclease-8
VPEGDSVYLVARRLDRALLGQQLTRTEFRRGDLADADLAGGSVVENVTHGKHLLTRFDHGWTLHTHLRMDGSWTVVSAGKRLPRAVDLDVSVLMRVASGVTAYGITLPVVEVVRTAEEHTVVGHLGPDPLRSDWNAAEAIRRLGREPDRPIAAALLDQRNVAGLGNLWVNELCFLRGASPWTPVRDVDLTKMITLARRTLRHSARVPGAYQVTTGDARAGRSHWVAGRLPDQVPHSWFWLPPVFSSVPSLTAWTSFQPAV